MAKNKEIEVSPKPQYELCNSEGLHSLAIELQDYCNKLNLVCLIKGKKYAMVEAWQFAGIRMGLIPIVVAVKDLSTEKECKWFAEVEIVEAKTGRFVGRGFETCSNKEANKKQFEEYAVLSMAQTRAIGKAFRNCCAWIMKSAGYEPTPAEEMDFAKNDSDDLLTFTEVNSILSQIENAKTIDDLKEAWNIVKDNYKLIPIDRYDKLKEAKDKMKIILSDKNNNNAFNLGGNI